MTCEYQNFHKFGLGLFVSVCRAPHGEESPDEMKRLIVSLHKDKRILESRSSEAQWYHGFHKTSHRINNKSRSDAMDSALLALFCSEKQMGECFRHGANQTFLL